MKKSIILTLVFMLIFPAYCFASPGNSVPTNDKSPIDENLVTEIIWALEDGILEQEEIDNLMEIAQFVSPCEAAIALFHAGLFGALAGIVFGGSWNTGVSIGILMLIVNAYFYCFAPNLPQD